MNQRPPGCQPASDPASGGPKSPPRCSAVAATTAHPGTTALGTASGIPDDGEPQPATINHTASRLTAVEHSAPAPPRQLTADQPASIADAAASRWGHSWGRRPPGS